MPLRTRSPRSGCQALGSLLIDLLLLLHTRTRALRRVSRGVRGVGELVVAHDGRVDVDLLEPWRIRNLGCRVGSIVGSRIRSLAADC